MRLPTIGLLFACCSFIQNVVLVAGVGCYTKHNPYLADASFSCALQFFATGMEGKSVALRIHDPVQGTYTTADAPFDSEKAAVDFSARISGSSSRASCLHLQKIEAIFKAPYNIHSIDTLVLDAFEGDYPATQDARGQCFKIEQRERRRHHFHTSVYGTVYVDLWCAFQQAKPPKPPGTPEQISFHQASSLAMTC